MKPLVILAALALPLSAHAETLSMTNHSSYSECYDLASDLDGQWAVEERGPARAVLGHGGLHYVLKRQGEVYVGDTARSRYGVRVTITMRLAGDSMAFTTSWNCHWESSGR